MIQQLLVRRLNNEGELSNFVNSLKRTPSGPAFNVRLREVSGFERIQIQISKWNPVRFVESQFESALQAAGGESDGGIHYYIPLPTQRKAIEQTVKFFQSTNQLSRKPI